MSNCETLTTELDGLLAAHEEIIATMRSGRNVRNGPARLLKINSRIHDAYRRLAALDPEVLEDSEPRRLEDMLR